MFFCMNMDNDIFTVLDTSDGVKEQFTKEDILGYLQSGVKINGVTEESLSTGYTSTVLVDFPSRGARCGCIFNGYYFEEYNEEAYDYYHNPYLYSIIPASECNIFDILSYIQDINSFIYKTIVDSYTKSDLGYRYICGFDNGMFNVKEMATGEEYGFSYTDVCSTLVNEKLRVEGFEGITKDYVKIFSTEFSIIDSIKYNLEGAEESATFYCDRVDCPEDCIDLVNVSSSGLKSFISKFGNKKLSKNKFPMVCLFDYAKTEPLFEDSYIGNVVDSLNSIRGMDFVKRVGNKFVFTGIELDDDIAILIHDMLRLTSPDFYNEVESYITYRDAKNKLLTGKTLSKKVNRAFRVNYQSENTLDRVTKEPHYDSYETEFGVVMSATYIRYRDLDEDDLRVNDFDYVDGLSLFRVSNLSTYYYRFSTGGITISLSDNTTAKRIINTNMTRYIDYFRDTLGYYSYRPNIMPLMVHSIVELDSGIEINVLVAVNTNSCKAFTVPKKTSDRDKGWGINYFVVPLMFTGVSHYFSGDFVIFDLLFQEFAMSKSVYNNMVANIDEFNDLIYIDGCTKATSSKCLNCEITSKETKNIREFKKIVRGEMFTFNRLNNDTDRFFE